MTIEFNLQDEYITLVNLLKYEGIIQTGGEINNLIENNLIKYNGEVEYRKRKKLYKNDIIEINYNDNKYIIRIKG